MRPGGGSQPCTRVQRYGLLARRLRSLIASAVTAVPRGVAEFRSFLQDLDAYCALPGAEPIHLRDLRPRLQDRTGITPFDPHYLHQDLWAFRRILESRARRHVDVGSRVEFVAFLTAITHVTFIDIRPLRVELGNFECKSADILHLPYTSGSVPSLSCLHVAEHIGLGRYGDSLDPGGSRKAMAELKRILAPGGNLYLSLPVGRPRTCFNAHRIHSPAQVLEAFSGLDLEDLCGVDDAGRFLEHCSPQDLAGCKYACGMFRFTRPRA